MYFCNVMTRNRQTRLLLAPVLALLTACTTELHQQRTVLCIPVYGQSLALGEEAERLTDFDALRRQGCGRIVTQRLDHDYGYFDPDPTKEALKRLSRYDRRSFELSAYAMATELTRLLGSDTLIAIFPGGQGATPFTGISRGTAPYERLLADIRQACDESRRRGWHFVVPALCWMHGETDMERRTATDYKEALRQFATDINSDVKAITGQWQPVGIVCYQTCQLTMARRFSPDSWDCPETSVPQAQMELVRDDTLFWASMPVYPLTFAHEGIHLTAEGQQQVGRKAAEAVAAIVGHGQRQRGLVPLSVHAADSMVVVRMHVPSPPLRWDTVSVAKAAGFGFSVIDRQGRNIARSVTISGDSIIIGCANRAAECRVRYAVGGEPDTTGPERGPRGNLCDSAVLPNWCYLFDCEAMEAEE